MSADSPTLIWQEHANGCVVASLAMVMGRTYREIAEDLCPKVGKWVYAEGKDAVWQQGISLEQDGICLGNDGFGYLVENGYALQTKYRYIYGNSLRDKWPLEPWADVHIALVETNQNHAVVLLRDGVVLDPFYGATTLARYTQVDSITAVWPVNGRAAARKALEGKQGGK